MIGKCRPILRAKTLENVKRCNLSQTDKDCIRAVFNMLVPQKVQREEYGIYCPNCNECLELPETVEHCYACGQALDWSDTE